MHIHCAAEEITVKVRNSCSQFALFKLPVILLKLSQQTVFQFQALICLVDKKSGEKSKTRPRFVKQDQVAIMRIECSGMICLEQFKLFPQMGRFTLRDESECFDFHSAFCLTSFLSFSDKTIAIGKVLKVIE